jgi:DNA-binding response OmpR family regulator
MQKLLIIDDEAPIRRLLRINLEDRYQIVDTGDPELALAAALQSKPNAILLDLRMPNYSGFELCRTFKSITSTQLIPIIIVTGEAGANTKLYCEELGATAYFEKPIDFAALRDGLAKVLQDAQPERRSEVRIRLRVTVKVQGHDLHAKLFEDRFEELCATENVSRGTFFCGCKAKLKKDSEVAVSLVSGGPKFVGMARVVRCDDSDPIHPRYAFRFVEKDVNWVLQ